MMWNAALWGGVSGSAVLLGALAAMYLPIQNKMIGYIMAFGTGVLIGAASYELLGESVHNGGLLPTGIGFVAGAIVFTLFDIMISNRGAKNRKRSGHKAAASSGIVLFAGTIMDAIPESIMIGTSLLDGGKVSFLLVTAIFISNFPEGLSSTSGMKERLFKKENDPPLEFGICHCGNCFDGWIHIFGWSFNRGHIRNCRICRWCNYCHGCFHDDA